MNPVIETPRTILRRFTLEDVDDAFEMNRHPEVRRYIVGEGEPTRERVRELIEANTLADYEKHGFGRLAIVHKSDNCFIGFTGLKFLEDMNEVDVGYRLRREYWGQGLATEATQPTIDHGFRELGLKRIIAMALVDNRASIRLMEKLNMQFERHLECEGHRCVLYSIHDQTER